MSAAASAVRAQRAALCLAAAVVTVAGFTAAATSASASLAQATPVGAVPSTASPDVHNGEVLAITRVGSVMVAGGSFTSVANHRSSTALNRSHVVAFDVSSGKVSSAFAPRISGTVRTLAHGPRSDTVYAGGAFTTVNGHRERSIALLRTTTGGRVATFRPPTFNGAVLATALVRGHLLVAGTFSKAGSAARGGLASLDPDTGALTSYAGVSFSGHHNYDGTGANGDVGPRAMAVNPSGTQAVVIGNFTRAGNFDRDQIALLKLGSSSATVDPNWATLRFTGACFRNTFDTYMRGVDYSPDGRYFVVAATGGTGRNRDGTKALCDSASRWEADAQGSDVVPTWVDFTGQDSLYSAAVTGSAVYVGGHQRWLNNYYGRDNPKEGAVPRPGLAALDPASGIPLSWNPGRQPRGAGAFALFASSRGLYVGSDTEWIGPHHNYHRERIAFFPLAGGRPSASTATVRLPANLYLAGRYPGDRNNRGVDELDYRFKDRNSVGALKEVPGTGVVWGSTRGAFLVGNRLFWGDATDRSFRRASFDGNSVGKPVVVDPYDDPTWSDVQTGSGQTYRGAPSSFYDEIPSVTGAFYYRGRLYYSMSGASRLHYRWFNPDSGIVGAYEFSVHGGNFSAIAGMTRSGSTVYYADSSGNLHAITLESYAPVGSTDHVLSGPATDGRDWRARGMFLLGSG